ncbi:alpha/beta fold hydrolase [Cellulomonas alba]|uniref:Alpha/beta fold hydrolase n=1 Tax=Cellulomonas alba TaxID=3053467 RepID=A0ABT7SJ49_9CELL|nr:alpha/beta fold hydrolase [Cellulomonas alba]MDM7856210.1 alpha/beta fold hydrolase [Cellulomonas alba]
MTSDPARRSAPATPPPAGLPGLDPRWSRVVDAAGSSWHVLDNGPTLAAEPVGTLLAVHGNPTWSYLWRTLVAAGARAERPWRVVAVDQLGMGFSARDERVRALAERVAELGALTEALQLTGPVVTAGHDWGGVVSLGWAVAHRDALAGVVLLNTAVHQPLHEHPPIALRPAMVPALRRLVTVTTPKFLDTTLALAHPRLDRERRAAFRAPYLEAARREAIGDFVADIPAVAGHVSRPALDVVADGVRGLDVPALLLWGARDPVFSDRFLDDLLDRLPHADLHRFPRAGHLVAEDVDMAGAVMHWLDVRGLGLDASAEPAAMGGRHRAPDVAEPAALAGGHAGVAPATPDPVVPAPDAIEPAAATPAPPGPWRPMTAVLDERAGDPGLALVELRGGTSRHVSWRLLARRVDELARGLATLGIRPGDRVAVLVPPGADLTGVLYACLRLGAVVVVADAGLGVQGLSRAVRSARPKAVVGIERALLAARTLRWAPLLVASGPVHRGVREALGVDATLAEVADLGRAGDGELPTPAPDDEAAVLFTSGSTGPAKGVVYTHRGLAAMRDAVAATYSIGPGSPFVAAFAPFALLGPSLGATSVSPDMDVTAPRTLTAAALAEAVRAVDGAVVFASPAAIAGVLATADALGADERSALGAVRTFLSAGAPVPRALLERLATLLPAARLHTPYGMTEMLPVTDVSLDELVDAGDGDGVCVGRPVAGARVEISALDAEGAATGTPSTEPGLTGEILVTGPHRKARYDRLWLTEQASSRDAGRHRTGDVGHLDATGRLWVEGRLDHVVVTAQGVLTPVGIEQRVDALGGVARSAAVGVGPRGTQQLVVVVEPDESVHVAGVLADEGTAAAVRAVTPHPVAAVLARRRLPTDVRHDSKIDRAALAHWAEGVLSGRRA